MIGLHIGQRSFDEAEPALDMAAVRRTKQAANIVRVAAQTASPIVSSVPKCRRSKSSRPHPLDTVGGISGSSGRALLSSQARPVELRSNGLNPQQTADKRLGKLQHLEADQVLLIVNDDHIKGGGVPIIGRRLPSKSAAMGAHSSYSGQQQQQHRQYHRHPSTDCLIVSADGERQQQVAQAAAPVIGRRSHRMIQQKQQQQVDSSIYQYSCHDYPPAKHPVESTANDGNNNSFIRANRAPQNYRQQPLSIVETHPYEMPDTLPSDGPRYPNYQPAQAASLMNLAEPVLVNEYYLPPMEKSSSRRLHQARSQPARVQLGFLQLQQQRYQIEANSANHRRSQQPKDSSSCSPMCSVPASLRSQLGDSTGGSYTDDYQTPCCSSPGCGSSGNLTAELLEPACCRAYAEQLCTAPCCLQFPVGASPTSKPSAGPSCRKSHPHHHHHHQHLPSRHSDASSGRSHRPAARPSHHHSSCQANGSLAPPSKPSVAYRSSSCHDSRRSSHNAHQPPAMMLSGRSLLPPVHPKPVLGYSARATSGEYLARNSATGGSFQSGQSNGSEGCAAVTQMYESLAAELKAKLGDPRLAPILLPPKDYDTMSRKQGKLNGIELRRSTNPQLVGPSANRPLDIGHKAAQGGRRCGTNPSISEEAGPAAAVADDKSAKQASTKGSSAGCGSSRSSGRSSGHDERASPRSRSNSSSGLGSISIEAGSPASSKLSSSEDMRQASCQSRLIANNGNFTCVNVNSKHQAADERQPVKPRDLPSDRKNPSPDNSDSGHSGSARLDSDLSNEERKSMLLGTSDQFYNPPSGCTPSPPINSTQMNNPKGEASQARAAAQEPKQTQVGRGAGLHNHNPSKVSSGVLWNGRVEVPLKVNSAKNGNTYLATKQIIY